MIKIPPPELKKPEPLSDLLKGDGSEVQTQYINGLQHLVEDMGAHIEQFPKRLIKSQILGFICGVAVSILIYLLTRC